MEQIKKRVVEVTSRPYAVVPWTKDTCAILYTNGDSSQALIFEAGNDKLHDLNGVVDKLNDQYEKALLTKVVTDNTVELSPEAMRMLERLTEGAKNYVDDDPLAKVFTTLLKEKEKQKLLSIFKNDITPSKLLETLIAKTYADGVKHE